MCGELASAAWVQTDCTHEDRLHKRYVHGAMSASDPVQASALNNQTGSCSLEAHHLRIMK